MPTHTQPATSATSHLPDGRGGVTIGGSSSTSNKHIKPANYNTGGDRKRVGCAARDGGDHTGDGDG